MGGLIFNNDIDVKLIDKETGEVLFEGKMSSLKHSNELKLQEETK